MSAIHDVALVVGSLAMVAYLAFVVAMGVLAARRIASPIVAASPRRKGAGP